MKSNLDSTPQMPETMFSVETIDEAVDYKQKYEELVHFIEMTEALTYDNATAKRIQTFLKQQGIWS